MKVFVDTSAFAALENRRDGNHRVAVAEFRKLVRQRDRLFTSDYVLDETITLLKSRAGPRIALSWGQRMLASALFDVLIVDRPLIEEALHVFADALDQAFSFTDCTSFAMMRSGSMDAAFAFDEDFTRFGFTCIPGRRRS